MRRSCIRLLAAAFVLLTLPALAASRRDRPGGHMEKATELFEAGHFRAAQVELLKARGAAEGNGNGDCGDLHADFMLTMCAVRLREDNALAQVNEFLRRHPGSIYSDRVRMAAGSLLVEQERFADALAEYRLISHPGLPARERDEYAFKAGYSHFMTGDIAAARSLLRQVGPGEYRAPALYYISYIDYAVGNYAAARQGFAALADDPAYGKIVPFYLLQIEFLEGNYDYVTQQGDRLLAAAEGARRAEIARIIAESWFHKGDYRRTLDHFATYDAAGGASGREEYYLRGYSYYMLGDARAAVDMLSRAAGPDDKLSQNAAYHMAAAYLELGNRRDALRSFSIAATSDFDEAIREDALFNYGKLQFELGGGVFNEAINVLSRYLSLYPRSPRAAQAREYLAAAYYNSRNYEAAYEAIRQIPDPDNNIRTAYQKIAYFRALDHYAKGQPDAAYSVLEEALRNRFNPKYTALTHFWMGEIRFERGEYERALESYRAFLAAAPAEGYEYRMALYNMGYSYFNLERWAEAESWFARFQGAHKAADSFLADSHNRRGDILYAGREFWKAIAEYEKAAAIDSPERYYGQLRRAVMLGFVDRPERKIESLSEIIRAGRGGYVGEAMYELGSAYAGQGRSRDATATLKRFADEYPSSPKYAAALSDLGLLYQRAGDNQTAIAYYKSVVERAPGSPQAKDAMLALRNIYVDLNDVESYFAYASRTGIETDLGGAARDSLAYVAAQNVYLQSADASKRAASLRSYLERYPRGAYRAGALYYLSELYRTTGRDDEATVALNELSGMHFNDFTVRATGHLASLHEKHGRHVDAAGAYKRLSEVAVSPATVSEALGGWLRSAVATGDAARIAQAVEAVSASSVATEQVKDEALFARAALLSAKGSQAEAMEIYRTLALRPATLVGARSLLRTIEEMYAAKRYDEAERAILDFQDLDTPHQYELGRAFLILGDIYAARGDNFQARATLQSIVDGYTPANDGIVEAAVARIEQLK